MRNEYENMRKIKCLEDKLNPGKSEFNRDIHIFCKIFFQYNNKYSKYFELPDGSCA